MISRDASLLTFYVLKAVLDCDSCWSFRQSMKNLCELEFTTSTVDILVSNFVQKLKGFVSSSVKTGDVLFIYSKNHHNEKKM